MTEEQKEKRREYNKKWRENNKEKKRECNKKWKENNKEKTLDYNKKWYHKNKENFKERKSEASKKWRENNKEKKSETDKKWYHDNKERKMEYAKKRKKLRRQSDPLFKLTSNIRSGISQVIARKGYKKTSKTMEILGIDFVSFKQYIENQFEPWMNWDNYGKYMLGTFNYGWDIDHIIPCSSATTEEEIIKLNHYTNLRPLCSKTNRDVKRHNIIAHHP